VSLLATELDGKRQEILMEAAPELRRMAAFADTGTTSPQQLQALQDATHARGVELSWGAPRIHGELFKLGIKISQATVGRYMPWRPKAKLIASAAEQSIAIDEEPRCSTRLAKAASISPAGEI
jgi:hypothetical protein